MYEPFFALLRRFLRFFRPVWKGPSESRFKREAIALETVKAPEEEPGKPWLKGEVIQEIQRFILTQRSPHTRRAYEQDLKQFLGFLRAEGLHPESLDALLAYREYLVKPSWEGGAGLKRASANRKFATIRSFLAWLQARGKVRENPSLWVKNFRAKIESPTQGFTDAEVAKMLTLPNQKSASGLSHALALHLLFYLGLRRSELTALRLEHFGRGVGGGEEWVTLRVPGKGDKERILPLPAPVLPVLERYLERFRLDYGQDRYLFQPVRNNLTKQKDKPLHPHAVYYMVRKYARQAGVESRVSPHSCRATCISNALDHSASHRSVQQLAGWSSPLMIERYDKRRTDLQQSAAHKVNY